VVAHMTRYKKFASYKSCYGTFSRHRGVHPLYYNVKLTTFHLRLPYTESHYSSCGSHDRQSKSISDCSTSKTHQLSCSCIICRLRSDNGYWSPPKMVVNGRRHHTIGQHNVGNANLSVLVIIRLHLLSRILQCPLSSLSRWPARWERSPSFTLLPLKHTKVK